MGFWPIRNEKMKVLISKLCNVVDNDKVIKTVYNKSVTKVKAIDTCSPDKSSLEKKTKDTLIFHLTVWKNWVKWIHNQESFLFAVFRKIYKRLIYNAMYKNI